MKSRIFFTTIMLSAFRHGLQGNVTSLRWNSKQHTRRHTYTYGAVKMPRLHNQNIHSYPCKDTYSCVASPGCHDACCSLEKAHCCHKSGWRYAPPNYKGQLSLMIRVDRRERPRLFQKCERLLSWSYTFFRVTLHTPTQTRGQSVSVCSHAAC